MPHKRSLKVAIYAGSIPDTTFLDLLINSLAKSGVIILLFGYKARGAKIAYENGVRVYVRPRHFLLKVFYVAFYLLLSAILYPNRLYKAFKYRVLDARSLKVFFLSASQVLPIIVHKPDIIHVQWIKSMEIFVLIKRVIDVKLIVSVRGAQVSISPFVNKDWKEKYVKYFSVVDRIHSISDYLVNQTVALGGPFDKIVKINPAVDLMRFPFRGNKPRSSEVFRLTTIARLSWNKGYLYVLQAVAQLKARGILCTYQIIGEGPQKEELLYLIHDLKLENEVSLLGRIPHEELSRYLRETDIFVLASTQEGFGNAVVEAQALGIPCIVSDAEGLPENIVHGETGLCVPNRNPEAICNALHDIYNFKQSQLYAMQNAARKRAENYFDSASQIVQFRNLYDKVCG